MKASALIAALALVGCTFEVPREALDAVCGDAVAASHEWCEADEQCRRLHCDCVKVQTLECASVGDDGSTERVWCDENGCYR